MPFSFDEQFINILTKALEKNKLEAIIVGNVAAILNGAPVLTQDIDLLIRDTPVNRRKLRLFAAAIHGSNPEPISELSNVERIYADVPVDIIFNHCGGTQFEAYRARARPMKNSRYVWIASLADVIRGKEIANRPKDKAVLPILKDTLRVQGLVELPRRKASKPSKKHRY